MMKMRLPFFKFLMCVLIWAGVVTAPGLVRPASGGQAQRQSLFVQKAQHFYEEGIRLYKEGEYEKARMKFLMVEALVEDYEATPQFLRRIDEHLQYETRRREELKEKALEDTQTEADHFRKRMSKIEAQLQKERDRQNRMKDAEAREKLKKEREEQRRKEKELRERERQERQERLEEKREKKRSLQEQRRKEQQARKAREERLRESALRKERKENDRREAEKQKLAEDHARQIEEMKGRLEQAALQPPVEPTPPAVEKKEEENAEPMPSPLPPAQESKGKAKRLEEKKKKIIAREQRRIRKELIQKSNDMYRELSAGYKAGRFDFSRDRIAELAEILKDPVLPASYRQKMEARLDIARNRLARYETRAQEKESQKESSSSATESRSDERGLAVKEKVQQKAALKEQKRRERQEQEQERARRKAERETQKQLVLEKRRQWAEDRRRQKEEDAALEVEIPDSVKNYSYGRDIIRRKNALQTQRTELETRLQKGVSRLYAGAVDLYQQGSLDMAGEMFIEIEKLWPDYEKTREYLFDIEQATGRTPKGALVDPEKKKTVSEALDDYEFMYGDEQ